MPRRASGTLVLVAGLVSGFAPAASPTTTAIADRVLSATVGISCTSAGGAFRGTGTIISPEGHVLTATSVVPADATGIRVMLPGFAVREARDEFDRRSALAESGAFSAGEARRLGLRADALDAKARALEAERPARVARMAAAEAELAAARDARSTLVAERGKRDEAAAELAHARAQRDLNAASLAAAELALARSEIRAPRAGVVLSRAAVPGARAGGEEGALFTLYDPAQLQVRCDVPLKDAARLAVGLVAEVRSDALPEARFKGTVVRIVPLGDLEKNTIQCKVLIENPDPALRPDMLVRVRIATTAEESARSAEAVAVPRDALRTADAADADEGEADVLVAVPEGAFARTELRRIALGATREGGWIEVLGGLAAGDRVVLDASIDAAARIRPVESLKGEAP